MADTILYAVTVEASITRTIRADDPSDAQRQILELITDGSLTFRDATELSIRMS